MGCSWALMLVGFAAGVANLWWMVALTAVMVFEKTGPSGDRAVKPIGLGLIGLGLLVLRSGSCRRAECGLADRVGGFQRAIHSEQSEKSNTRSYVAASEANN